MTCVCCGSATVTERSKVTARLRAVPLPAPRAAVQGAQRRNGTRRGCGSSWHVDETCLKFCGRWCSLCRAIDRDGNLIDAMLNEHRDMKKAFFSSARAVMSFRPDRVTKAGTAEGSGNNLYVTATMAQEVALEIMQKARLSLFL